MISFYQVYLEGPDGTNKHLETTSTKQEAVRFIERFLQEEEDAERDSGAEILVKEQTPGSTQVFHYIPGEGLVSL